MKKIISMFLAVVFVLSLSACGSREGNSNTSQTSDPNYTGAPDGGKYSRILIAYFSIPEDIDTTDAVAGASIVDRMVRKWATPNMLPG